MCGIAGLAGNNLLDGGARLAKMSQALLHRGPDDAGAATWPANGRSPFTGFAHRRLSIIDLSAAGRQPMATADGRFSIVFNGEVYNYRVLRRELEHEGVQFTSDTDTEVLLHLYTRRGVGCLKQLRGMFVFAVRDNESGEVFIARDHLGIKPLYYYKTGKLFVFASELRALLASGLVPRRVDCRALNSYLQTGSVTSPLTIIEGVKSLRPGHSMSVVPRANSTLEVMENSYVEDWLAGVPTAGLERPEAVEILRDALEESMRLHLVSDVPLGAFLSGGIDSSAVIALMSRVTGERPKTFSIVFAETKFSEAAHARRVAAMFGTEHHEIHLSEQQLLEMLPPAIGAEDQPTMDGINTYAVSKAVKESGITVALSGLGGDELFAGYPTFRRAIHLKSAARVPGSLRKGFASFGQRIWDGSVQRKKLWQLLSSDGSPAATYAISRQLFSPGEVNAFFVEGVYQTGGRVDDCAYRVDEILTDDAINAVSLCEIRGYMANTLLRDTDFMSMAHSLEVRVPFVDSEVVRFVLGLPGEWKVNGGRQKPLLQDALSDLLPPQVTNRPKMGFALPFQEWMLSRLRNELESAFGNEQQFESIGLRPAKVREVWRRFLLAPENVGWSRPWALYVLGRWCAQHHVGL